MVNIAFLHLDLGIGGAERLVVDSCLALQRRSHSVTCFTTHHDHTHCFPETVDGSVKVVCCGDWLPRAMFGRYFAAFFAFVRMIYLALYVAFFCREYFDVAFVDQVSACIPFLRLCRGVPQTCGSVRHIKILFYCHYPDQLLTERRNFLKKLYRCVIDWVEERTTACADKILVNSYFTAAVFKDTFKSIITELSVLYPSIDFSRFDNCKLKPLHEILHMPKNGILSDDDNVFFLSVNRFEGKKNLGLAIHSLSELFRINSSARSKVHLVIAGGFDLQNRENKEYFDQLLNLCSYLNIKVNPYFGDESNFSSDLSLSSSYDVTFLKSPDEIDKISLLRQTTCLLYTPDREHFGIVPLEAMYCGTPVIAVNSGGPTETVLEGVTGYLRENTMESFADAMNKFLRRDGETKMKEMLGKACIDRVMTHFSFSAFEKALDKIVIELVDCKKSL